MDETSESQELCHNAWASDSGYVSGGNCSPQHVASSPEDSKDKERDGKGACPVEQDAESQALEKVSCTQLETCRRFSYRILDPRNCPELSVFDMPIEKTAYDRLDDLQILFGERLCRYVFRRGGPTSPISMKLRFLGTHLGSAELALIILCVKPTQKRLIKFLNKSEVKEAFEAPYAPGASSFKMYIGNIGPVLLAGFEDGDTTSPVCLSPPPKQDREPYSIDRGSQLLSFNASVPSRGVPEFSAPQGQASQSMQAQDAFSVTESSPLVQYAAEMQAAGRMPVPIIQSESENTKQVSPLPSLSSQLKLEQKRKEQNRIAQKNFRSRSSQSRTLL